MTLFCFPVASGNFSCILLSFRVSFVILVIIWIPQVTRNPNLWFSSWWKIKQGLPCHKLDKYNIPPTPDPTRMTTFLHTSRRIKVKVGRRWDGGIAFMGNWLSFYIGHHPPIPAARKEQPKPICDLSSFSTIVPCEEPLHVPTVRLRRSRTAPSRRRKYGEHEPPQVVHVNRYASQGILCFLFPFIQPIYPFFSHTNRCKCTQQVERTMHEQTTTTTTIEGMIATTIHPSSLFLSHIEHYYHPIYYSNPPKKQPTCTYICNL